MNSKEGILYQHLKDKEQEKAKIQRRNAYLAFDQIASDDADSRSWGKELAELVDLLGKKDEAERAKTEFPEDSLNRLNTLADYLSEAFGPRLIPVYRIYIEAEQRRELRKLEFNHSVLGK